RHSRTRGYGSLLHDGSSIGGHSLEKIWAVIRPPPSTDLSKRPQSIFCEKPTRDLKSERRSPICKRFLVSQTARVSFLRLGRSMQKQMSRRTALKMGGSLAVLAGLRGRAAGQTARPAGGIIDVHHHYFAPVFVAKRREQILESGGTNVISWTPQISVD